MKREKYKPQLFQAKLIISVILLFDWCVLVTNLSHCLQKCTVTCFGIPSEMSTWVRRQATHMLAGLGGIGTPQVQHRLWRTEATLVKLYEINKWCTILHLWVLVIKLFEFWTTKIWYTLLLNISPKREFILLCFVRSFYFFLHEIMNHCNKHLNLWFCQNYTLC